MENKYPTIQTANFSELLTSPSFIFFSIFTQVGGLKIGNPNKIMIFFFRVVLEPFENLKLN